MENSEELFEQELKDLEKFVPELSGISSIWETKDKITLFSELTIPIARHHKSNDKQIARLQATTQRLIDTAPEEALSASMDLYTSVLVTCAHSIQEELFIHEQWSTEILEMKEQIAVWHSEADVSFMDDFFTCVDSLETNANKEMTKMFATLANKMDRAARSIEKMQRTDQDFLIETLDAISSVFTPYILKLDRLESRVFSANCYNKIDFRQLEQIASDLGENSP